ncbi:alpha/beta-type small acid-soluble spore protein [Dehalobacter sp. DCM]|uniref:small, acid-soluble spore protein, alpha/beta type n=1 Tax=Dehalobacter sp. DCM TaxID=2907827 RepID=UPI00308175BC|nr:alpha/beta-type small acid-soluble spore protein [Dehalobacter sp. DCM]
MARFKPLSPESSTTAGSTAQTMGIEPVDEDGGEMTSREAGNMVKRMVQYAENHLKNNGHI